MGEYDEINKRMAEKMRSIDMENTSQKYKKSKSKKKDGVGNSILTLFLAPLIVFLVFFTLVSIRILWQHWFGN